MATKPTSKIDWTKGNAAPASARTEPSPGKKTTGWTVNERPPFQFMNWLFYNINEWIDYLEDVTDSPAEGVALVDNAQSPYDAEVATRTIICDTTAGSVEIDLPDAATVNGSTFTIVKSSGDQNSVIVEPFGAQTINGLSASRTFTRQWAAFVLRAQNGNWVIVSKSNPDGFGLMPVGTIIPWVGGYFGDASNGSYTHVLGAGNTVAQVNTWLNDNHPYLRVCDGSAINDAVSPIWNAASRHLPNLTDDRFLMGDTVIGGIGGNNAMAHTHSVPSHFHGTGTLAVSSSGAHTHSVSGSTNTTGDHAHVRSQKTGEGNSSVNSAIGNGGVPDQQPNTGTAGSHSHSVSGTAASASHTHTNGDFTGSVGNTGGVNGDSAMTSGAASNDENRPKYLACMYLIRFK